ncbi:MAG: Mth938-like domain-containing protein [Gammaproteobacteria bacterium]
MQVNQEINVIHYAIHAYTDESITVSVPIGRVKLLPTDEGALIDHSKQTRETFSCSVVVSPNELIRDWPPRSFSELTVEHFDSLLTLQPEIVLLGTGSRLRWPETALYASLIEKGIGLEVMDTGAACRTYNILMADERKVVAALLFT